MYQPSKLNKPIYIDNDWVDQETEDRKARRAETLLSYLPSKRSVLARRVTRSLPVLPSSISSSISSLISSSEEESDTTSTSPSVSSVPTPDQTGISGASLIVNTDLSSTCHHRVPAPLGAPG